MYSLTVPHRSSNLFVKSLKPPYFFKLDTKNVMSVVTILEENITEISKIVNKHY